MGKYVRRDGGGGRRTRVPAARMRNQGTQGDDCKVGRKVKTEDCMKGLLLIIVLLLCFTPSGVQADGVKDPVYPPYCWISPTGSNLWYVCGSEEAFNANCVQRMEFAMHQVDQVIISGTKPTKEIIDAWNRAKHDCWKDFEQERASHAH